MIVTHFQLTAIGYSFNLRFPPEFLKVVRIVLNFFTFDFVQLAGPECGLGYSLSYRERWTIAVFAPLMLTFPFALGAGSSSRSLAVTGILVSTTFIWGILTSMEIWACEKDEDGVDRLIAAQEIECRSGNGVYDSLLTGSIFMFIWYFFISQMIFYALTDTKIRKQLVGEFKEEYAGWFFLMNFIKFFAVIGLLYMQDNPIGQAILMISIYCVAFLFTCTSRPYDDDTNTNIDCVYRLVEIAQMSVAIMTYRGNIDKTLSTILFAVLFTLSCILSIRLMFSTFFKAKGAQNNYIVGTVELKSSPSPIKDDGTNI